MGFGSFLKSAIGAIAGPAGTAIGGPVGGMIGSAIGAGISGWGAEDSVKQTNAANAKQAQAQMDFQERMSNTSWQRGVTDMKLAGLNPMLAYSQGGASTPFGAKADMGNAGLAGIQTAMASTAQQANVANIKADTDNKKAQSANIEADTALKRSQVPFTEAGTGKTLAETDRTNREIEKMGYEIGNIVTQSDLNVAERKRVLQEYENAIKTGRKIDAETGNIKVDTALKEVQRKLDTNAVRFQEYDNQGRYNKSEGDRYSAWWQQRVAPFLPDILKSTNSAVSAGYLLK